MNREVGGVLLDINEFLKISKNIVYMHHEFIRVDLVYIFRLLVVHKPPHQVIYWNKQLYEVISALEDGRNYILLDDFNSRID